MRLLKFKRDIEIEKTIGNIHIETFHYGSYDKNGKHKHWTELECWCECDCECCPLSWEDRGYEGECYDWGCYMAEPGKDYPKISMICVLPNWIKKLILRHIMRKRG